MRKLIVLLLLVLPNIGLTGCSGSGGSSNSSIPSSSAIDLGGTWTLTTTSTQGQRNLSATATVTQTGAGVGKDGATTLTAPMAKLVISQTGTVISGTITNTLSSQAFNFSGTLSNGNLFATGPTVCASSNKPEVGSITATVTSTTIQGSYTASRNGCSFSDAGTFLATKK